MTELPNDGYIYYHIQNKELLLEIKQEIKNIEKVLKKRWNILQKYVNEFLTGKIHSVNQHSNLENISSINVSRKKIKDHNKNQEARTFIFEKLKDYNKSQKRQNKIEIISSLSNIITIKLYKNNDIFKKIREIKCRNNLNDVLYDFMNKHHIEISPVICKNVMKLIHLHNIHGLWFIKIPSTSNDKNYKFPKGFKKLKLSQYWSMIERNPYQT